MSALKKAAPASGGTDAAGAEAETDASLKASTGRRTNKLGPLGDVTAIWSPDIHQPNGSPYYANEIGALLAAPLEAYPDACLLPYVCDPPRRLGVADAATAGTRIAWIPIDLDSPAKARPEIRGTAEHEEWQARQLERAAAFSPPPAVWESPSGGLRLLWRAAPGSVTPLDYDARCAAFLERLRAWGFEGVDPTAAQWVRHQRLPRGGDVIGTPGELVLPPAPAGAAILPSYDRDPDAPVTDTVLFRMFEAAELPIGWVRTDKASVVSLWDEEHSDHGAPGYDPLSGRAVILADVQGKGMGVFKCQHGHCAHRGNADVLALLRAESPAAARVLEEHDMTKAAFASALLETVAPVAPANDVTASVGCDPAVDAIIKRLAAPSVGVFQRSGHLCTVTREAHNDGDVVRAAGAPTIRELPGARLKEIVRVTCGPRDVSLAPDVAARGEWAHIRPLDAIVTYPVMRRDGSLLTTNGYDAATRTLAEIDVRVTVKETPTHADAERALATLADLVVDFPFCNDAQRSAWLAMLLTVPARPAIDGPTPLGLLEASQRGSGKTLLADVISVVATGREAPRRVAPKTKEEWDKTMLATLLAGDPVVLIDNVTTMLASDALDAVLTGTTYTQRLLGVSEERRVAVRTVFLASSNNARLSSDLVRRSVACRLEPAEERPETRTGFRHPDLLRHVRDHRADLLGATLTVLRAYAVAGRPVVPTRPMGSYAGWCRVVRDALVWAGGDDPASTQDALRESADVERDELTELLTAWHAELGEQQVTVRQALEAARRPTGDALLDAFRGITPNGGEPTPHAIGNGLRKLRGQIVGGLVLKDGTRDNRNTATWQVKRG